MEFRGIKFYLSNNYQCPLDMEIGGVTYHFLCAEAAFQASRCPGMAGEFEGKTGKEAKEIGKKAKKKDVRPDWDDVKMSEFDRVLEAKFKNPTLKEKLLGETSPIVMENSYNDRYWGVVDGRGQNRLGKALDRVKTKIEAELGLLKDETPSVVSYKVQQGGIVVFDTETTGTSANYDDILQITIVGQDGSVLLDTYVKPDNSKEWKDAENINHITKDMVANAPSAQKVAEVVKKIFDHADYVAGQNVAFDIKMVSACFGYDFEAKEKEIEKKFPARKENEINSKVEDIKRIISEVRECKEVKGLDVKDFPDSLTTNPIYKKIRQNITGGVKGMLNLTDEEISALGYEIANSVYIIDTLKDFRYYKWKFGVSTENEKLITQMRTFFPMEADVFESAAHDAKADTVATLKVATKLNELLERDVNLGHSVWEDKLFGISEGIVCHQVNCQGISPKDGFTARLFDQFPNLKQDFRNKFVEAKRTGEELFGNHYTVPVDEKGELLVATIYAQQKAGNAERTGIVYTDEAALLNCISEICKEHPDVPVYLPVIHNNGVIVDGIGCGKAGLKWEDFAPKIKELDYKNLYTVDTGTGETCKINDERMTDLSKTEELENDGFEFS